MFLNCHFPLILLPGDNTGDPGTISERFTTILQLCTDPSGVNSFALYEAHRFKIQRHQQWLISLVVPLPPRPASRVERRTFTTAFEIDDSNIDTMQCERIEATVQTGIVKDETRIYLSFYIMNRDQLQKFGNEIYIVLMQIRNSFA